MHEFGPDLQVVLPLIASVCSFNVTFFGTFLEKDHLKKNQRKKKQICMGQNKEVPC